MTDDAAREGRTAAAGRADPGAVPDEEEGGSAAPAQGHVAVVYVHGIGSQRRYEEVSRLIDRLDDFQGREHDAGRPRGLLRDIDARVEPLRGGAPGAIIGYVRVRHVADAAERGGRTVRFYEIYWAPVMAGQASAREVLTWLLRQPIRPLRTLRSPWRERQRLRRAALLEWHDRRAAQGAPLDERRVEDLIRLYGRFERLDARRDFPSGSFEEFEAYLRQRLARHPERLAVTLGIARDWRRAYRRRELSNLLVLVTLALGLVLVAGAAAWGVLGLLRALLRIEWVAAAQGLGFTFDATWGTALGLVFLVGGLLLGGFLRDYLGDVQAWATYQETSAKHAARRQVLAEAKAVLSHVLGDRRCERVAVVAHSLGTSIAHDALLGLFNDNRAAAQTFADGPGPRPDPMDEPVPLGKIEHLVTLGSPIDKIEYFFESHASPSHRYTRVVESLRGDVGTGPFCKNRTPHIHWINVWDDGDLISGALHSPASGDGLRSRVDNLHVATYRFPSTARSHLGYFENAAVVGLLYDVIFDRARSFRTLVPPPRFASTFVGPGSGAGRRAAWLRLALALPWAAAAGLLLWALEPLGVPILAPLSVGAGAALGLAALAMAAAESRRHGSLDPVRRRGRAPRGSATGSRPAASP